MEVFKLEEGAPILAFVMADFDWDTFSANHYRSYFRLANGQFMDQAHSTLDTGSHDFEVWEPRSESVRTAIGHYPVVVYNFDLLGLNYVFRHLKDPEGSVDIGIADPTWDDAGVPFAYMGTVTIAYIGDEDYKGTACRKYTLGGPGLNNQTGYIWADRELGHFVNVEHPWRDNPDWIDFKLELQSMRSDVSLAEWHELVATSHAEHLEKNREASRSPSRR